MYGDFMKAAVETKKISKIENVQKSAPESKRRYVILDTIRGFALVNMILYHFLWDMVFLCGMNHDWLNETLTEIWQTCICCTFILLSGFCQNPGSHMLKRGLTVFFAGGVVTAVTVIFVPQNKIIFGILTMLGTAMLLMIPLKKLLKGVDCCAGAAVAFLLFLLTYDMQSGIIGIFGTELFRLPEALYNSYIGTFFGFKKPDFFSADYFPLVPWMFLFLTGYFLYGIFVRNDLFEKRIFKSEKTSILSFIGRHTLIIYMLHQPVMYLAVILGRFIVQKFSLR